MKILITESQLKKIIREDISKNNPYLNKILDKIGSEGIDSLSPEEKEALQMMAQGENLDDPEMTNEPIDEPMDEPDMGGEESNVTDIPRELDNTPYMLFVDIFPREPIDLMNDWVLRIGEHEGVQKLIITNEGSDATIYMLPFWNETKIIVSEEGTDVQNRLDIDESRVPQNEEEMHRFINEFIRAIPKIINKLIA